MFHPPVLKPLFRKKCGPQLLRYGVFVNFGAVKDGLLKVPSKSLVVKTSEFHNSVLGPSPVSSGPWVPIFSEPQ